MAVNEMSPFTSVLEKTTPNSLSSCEMSMRWLSEVQALEVSVERSGPI